MTRAAESLDAMVLLAVRGLDRIEQLEQQLAAMAAGSNRLEGIHRPGGGERERCARNGRGRAQARPQRAQLDPQALLRQLQKALAVTRCIRLAAEYGEDDALDISDALAGELRWRSDHGR